MSFRGRILLKPSMVRKHFNYNEKVMTNVNNNTKRGGNSPFFNNDFSCFKRWIFFLWLFSSKVWSIKNNTNLNLIFCFIKSSKMDFIFSPAFYLIMWLMTLANNFEKIAILKKWQLVFFWDSKFTSVKYLWNDAFWGIEIFYFHQNCPSNSYCSHQM